MEGKGFMKIVLSSHEIILSAEPLGKLETEIPLWLHPIEQKQGGIELPFTQSERSFPEYDYQRDET